jgi:hypothetical protein
MNSMFSRSRVVAAALTVAMAALAGCNAVEDVREEPLLPSPPEKVVLQGTVSGLGSIRNLALSNNNSTTDTLLIAAPVPQFGVANVDNLAFSFGAREVRDAQGNPVPYNIRITSVPYGRSCAFEIGVLQPNGIVSTAPSGILSGESPPYIVIKCVPNVPLFDVTVDLDAAFASAPGATVTLRTEDGIFEHPVTAADITALKVVFPDKLFNAAGAGAPTPSPVFTWSVSGSTLEGGTLNRCPVTNAGNPTATTNPTADVTGPRVRACTFTISGTVHYSRPAEATADSSRTGPLTLELRNLGGVKKGTATVAAGGFPANFTFTNTATSTTAFTSNQDADFQVVVTGNPPGQTCIATDGGYVSLKALIGLNPFSVTGTGTLVTGLPPAAGVAATANLPIVGTRLVLFCRNTPAAGNALHGVYRLTKTTALMVSTTSTNVTTTNTVVSAWTPFDFTVQNTAASNILTFFSDGTFLYGTHSLNPQVEHGFYDYSPTALANSGASPGRLRFTLHTDTWFGTGFPSNFSSAPITGPNNSTVNTAGLSALPGALTVTATPASLNNAPAATRHVNMGNVVKTAAAGSVPAKITGRTGPYGGTVNNPGPGLTAAGVIPAPTAPAPPAAGGIATTTIARQVDWELTDVPSLDAEMTGGWITQDRRRFWVWDKGTSYGAHAGVNGLVNIQSACVVTTNFSAPSGELQRRAATSGCYAINRPATGQTPPYVASFLESVDNLWLVTTHAATSTATTAGAGAPAAASTANLSGIIQRLGNVAPGIYNTAAIRERFPEYEARMPGVVQAQDGRSASPTRYHIAPAATFFAAAPPEHFPQSGPYAPAAAFTTWCTTEILGLRATLNGTPFQEPVYMCRTRAQ